MRVPFVSVILAVRNEEQYIARALEAVLHQDYPSDAMEILVADGASDDDTLEIVRSLPDADRIRVLNNPRRVQAAGLNLAILHSRGDVIVRVDGHTVIAQDYVRQCVDVLTSTGAANVGGRMVPVGLTPMGRAIALAGTTRFAVPTAFHVSTTPQFTDTVYLGAWPRTILATVGGFDERLAANEDYELNYRIRRAGGRIYLTPAIRSTYLCRQSLHALARQYLRYGIGKAQMLRMHPASGRLRHLVAPAFVAVVVCGLALWPTGFVLAHLLYVAVILSYGTAVIAFSVSTAARSIGYGHGQPDLCAGASVGGRGFFRLLWRLPLVYLTVHLAWGCGFWWGVCRDKLPAPLRMGGDPGWNHRHVVRPSIAADALRGEDRHGS